MTEAPNSFDPVWEQIYQAGGHANRYPWDAVVSFVFRHRPRGKAPSQTAIVEIGCGTGSNLWFAARETFIVAGIDGSAQAIAQAKRRFADDGLEADLRVGTFQKLPWDSGSFDLAIDRAALTCVGLTSAVDAIAEVHRVLRPGGAFFCNVYSDRHSSFLSGTPGPDGVTLDIKAGTLVNVGQLCFYGRDALLGQFPDRNWSVVSLDHVTVEQAIGNHGVHGEWRLIATKR